LEVGCGQGVGAEVILDRLGAAELARHGLHGTGTIEQHFGGALFLGAARKS
jgi:hypothetical protein